LGGGSIGSISVHRSSSRIGLAMFVPPCTGRGRPAHRDVHRHDLKMISSF
jgi:hypothetical protein